MLSPNEQMTLRRINSGARPSVLRGEDVKVLMALGLVINGRLLVLTAAGRDYYVKHMRSVGPPGKWSLLATHPKHLGVVSELYARSGAAEARAASLRLAGFTVDLSLLKL